MKFERCTRKPNLKSTSLIGLSYMFHENKKGIQQVLQSIANPSSMQNANKLLDVHHFIAGEIQDNIRRFNGISPIQELSKEDKQRLNNVLVKLFNYYTTMLYSSKPIAQQDQPTLKEIDEIMKEMKQNTLQEKIKDFSKENLNKLREVAYQLLSERMSANFLNIDNQNLILDDFNAWIKAIDIQIKNKCNKPVEATKIEKENLKDTLAQFCKYKPQENYLVAESIDLTDDSIFPSENLPF
jgi:hypothetical protein